MGRLPHYPGNRKVRGLKRRLREAERFLEEHRHLNMKHLDDSCYLTADALINPWFRENREPPLHFRRAWLKAMCEIHDAWDAQLYARGEPYHLCIRLWQPAFCESRVAAYVDFLAEEYRTMYPSGAHVPQTPPREYYAGLDLDRYNWRGCDVTWEDRLSEYSEEAQKELRRNAMLMIPTADGDYIVKRRIAHVWTATAKQPPIRAI